MKFWLADSKNLGSQKTRFYTFTMFKEAEGYLASYKKQELGTVRLLILCQEHPKEFTKIIWVQNVVRDYRSRLGHAISL